MAVIKLRGSSWEYTISHYKEGKYSPFRKSGFKSRKECAVAAAEVELQFSKGIVIKTKDKPFASYFKEWVETYKVNKHSTTYDRYMNSCNRVKEYFKDKPIQKITRSEYQQFLNRYGTGKTHATVRKLNTHIRACVKDAMEEGYLALDFTRKIELHGTSPTKNDNEKHIEFEESKRLLKYLFTKLNPKVPTYHLILLALVSGMRYGELMGLTRKNFDFKNNQILITRGWDYKKGTGFTPLKTKESERNVSIDITIMLEFKKLFISHQVSPNGLVFYRSSSSGCITNENSNKVLARILNDLNIQRITMHGLRHTHASILLYKGVNIQSVSQRLGHSDIQTTLDHYAHVLKEMKERDQAISAKVFRDMISM